MISVSDEYSEYSKRRVLRNTEKINLLLRKMSTQFIFFPLSIIIFNKEYFLDNNLKIYLLQNFRKTHYYIFETRVYFLLKNTIKLIEKN